MDQDVLVKLRKQNRMTQAQLAEALGLSTSTIGMYEQGRREPDHKTILKMADFFGVSVDYLMGHEKAVFPSDAGLFLQALKETLAKDVKKCIDGMVLSEEEKEEILQTVKRSILSAGQDEADEQEG